MITTKKTLREHITILCDPEQRESAWKIIPTDEKWDTHSCGPTKKGRYRIKASRQIEKP
tara:strand:+ start:6356 stop:6532 length:177 start_codon:yes stop_codon:yes gene_type:complete